MKKYIFTLLLLVSFEGLVFAQNIELPDLTTVISGETVKAGADALPDFKDVMVVPEGSGNVVPVLPDVDTPADTAINPQLSGNAEKTIFAEGMIGGGYPSLFAGNFSVFRLSGASPFKISFGHDSAIGYGNHSLQDGFSDRSTNLLVEKSFQNKQYTISLNGGYESISNGLQRHIPGLTSLNQDVYSAGGSFLWDFNEIFSAGINTGVDFYNRYADIASGTFDSASVIDLNPELFAVWKFNNFDINLSAAYTMENDFANQISEEAAHRGQFGLNVQWSNDVLKAYGNVAAVVGNRLNDNSAVIPFTVGIDSTFPVYFSNRRFSILAEGGLDSKMNKIAELEKKYKFSQLKEMPSETSDWYGRLNFSVPVKESFTGNLSFEYRQTANNNGNWQPLSGVNESLFGYNIVNMQQFMSDITLTYHYKIFSVTGGWHSNWLDVPVMESAYQVSLDLNLQSEDSKWGADLKGIMSLDGDIASPIINFEGFVRLTSSVRAVLNVEDAVKLITGEERVYAGNYICRGGTVTALLKFFF